MNYNETVLDHFANPRNAGKMKNSDAVGETGNPADGDRIIIYLRIQDNHLLEVRFQTFGCAAAIAASSMLTVLATGKTIEEARNITNEDVAQALGGLPPQKHDCSNIAANALQDALDNYEAAMNTKPAEAAETAVKHDLGKVDATCQENMEQTAIQQAADLSPQQVQRYLRQIIMPQISGKGQETLLKTHVILYMPSLQWGGMMLAYLAAVGVGQITCVLENMTKGSEIIRHVMDLNPETQLEVMPANEPWIPANQHTTNAYIVIGPDDFAARHTQKAASIVSEDGVPHIFVGANPWKGTLWAYGHNLEHEGEKAVLQDFSDDALTVGQVLSASFGGTLAVIELVKIRLDIGRKLEKPFTYDLMNMTFGEEVGDDEIESLAVDTYNDLEHLNDDELHQRLAKGKVLVIGSGGLGSPASFALAQAGIGTLGLVDHDYIDLSNLNRQILHTTSRIGQPKVASGAITLEMLNSNMRVNIYQERMTETNVDRLLMAYDLLLDGLDNLPSRYVANKAAVAAAKPFVSAGVLTFYGQSTSILPGDGPCYECIFPQTEGNGNAPTCEETGVLGAVPGLMGIIQAAEVIKLLCDTKPSLQNQYLMVDALEREFTTIQLPRKETCPVCGGV
ncbi:MAG: ThiF family adenylyltransferase [Bacillota bacterium]|nr:ThiF family adenylyltransferase [Bacillota bacterium]MDW7678686.1 ThiF family adenylyltransferase [Bacillota bacterium]